MALVQANPGTTDEQRRDLKISIRDTDPTPIPAPTDIPQLVITNQLNNRIEFRLFAADGSKARPEGATGAYIYCWIGDDVPAELIDWKFRGKATRSKNEMTFSTDLPAGTVVRLTSMWVNAKGQPGPACSPVLFRLPGAVDGNGFAQAA